MGFKKADDFYVAIGGGKVQVGQVVSKVIGRLKTTEVVAPEEEFTISRRARRPAASTTYGIVVDGAADTEVLVRMAKCCTPVPGDDVVGYISVGRGITVHREDCPNVRALRRNPERFTAGSLGRRQPGHDLVPRHHRPRSRGTARACSRTSPGRSPSTAATSSSTAATSPIRWRATGTRSRWGT